MAKYRVGQRVKWSWQGYEGEPTKWRVGEIYAVPEPIMNHQPYYVQLDNGLTEGVLLELANTQIIDE